MNFHLSPNLISGLRTEVKTRLSFRVRTEVRCGINRDFSCSVKWRLRTGFISSLSPNLTCEVRTRFSSGLRSGFKSRLRPEFSLQLRTGLNLGSLCWTRAEGNHGDVLPVSCRFRLTCVLFLVVVLTRPVDLPLPAAVAGWPLLSLIA